ncbi:hypothetical protein [Hydrogenophaga sp. RWCD_12]|uniref:hypothetical protein n=1 Tax=Hydrogenophaga sp. RWCD_12 TaxID=3391190 RepID=UPI0039851688
MSVEIQGLVLTDLPETGAFAYRPLRPSLARSEDGRAQFSFIRAGSVNMLSFTAVWEAPQSALDRARDQLAAQHARPAQQIRLVPEALVASPAELRFGDGTGQWTTAATTASSGVAPFQAAFSAMLSPEQAECLLKATAGETGWMGVAYRLTPVHAPVRHSTLDAQSAFTAEASVSSADPEDLSADLRTEASASVSAAQTTTPNAPAVDESFGDAAHWGLPKP